MKKVQLAISLLSKVIIFLPANGMAETEMMTLSELQTKTYPDTVSTNWP